MPWSSAMSWRVVRFRLSFRRIAMTAIIWIPTGAAADAPAVVKASPDNGDTDVDPNLKEIRIEFDQDMLAGSHSICGGGDSFPEMDGKPRWVDKRTMVIPVKLGPKHDYHIGVNCPAAMGFKSAAGVAVEPYPIS